MILKDKIMLFVYSIVLLLLGGSILALLVGFSMEVMGSGTWIYENYPGFIDWFNHTIGDSIYRTLIVFLVGIILALMGYNILRSLCVKQTDYKTITIQNPMGEIRIPLAAVEDFIQKCGVKMDDVREIRSKIKARKKEVRVVSRISIWAGGRVPDIADRVQEVIKQNMEELLGMDTKIRVNVSVDRISPRTSTKDVSIESDNGVWPYQQ